jgi:GT2 family glycosyltransferase
VTLVSVFVPCHNYGHYLEECVSSVLTQEGVDVEVLVIDDASSDDSAEVAARLAAADPRVSIRVHATNRGHIATYNEGLEWVRGDYLLLLSADDALVPGALRRAVAVLDAHPSVGFLFGDVPRPGDEGRPLRTEGTVRLYTGHEWLEERCATGYNVVPVPTAVVRAAVQRQVGGYLPAHPHAGDLEMWLRLAAHADVAELDTHQGVYRRHATSMSSAAYAHAGVEDLVACSRAFDEVLMTHRDAIADADRLRTMARRACARRMVGRASTVYDAGAGRADFVDTLLGLAFRTDPSVRRSAVYAKFRLRRALGFRTASTVARLRPRSAARGRRRAAPASQNKGAAVSRDAAGHFGGDAGLGRPRVAAVVVTHNRSAVLGETLRALAAQSVPLERVIVVDNASRDDTQAMLRRDFPGVDVLAMPDNVGFGAGLAVGMRRAVGENAAYCWLLDDDSRPDPTALAGLLAAARAQPGAGIVGYFGGASRWGVPRRTPFDGTAPDGTVLDGLKIYRRDWCLVDGALVPRRTMEDVGYPRTDLFMMMEDIEYTGRISRTGADVLVLQPDLMTRAHLGSAGPTRAALPWREYYQTRNHLLIAVERRSPRELAGWALRQARFVLADATSRQGRRRIGFRLRGAAHGLRGVTGRSLEPR